PRACAASSAARPDRSLEDPSPGGPSQDTSAGEEARLDGQLVLGEVEGLARELLAHALELVHDAPGTHDGHPLLGAALALTHAGLGGLLRDGLVREDADVELAAALDVAGDRDTRRLDLAGRHEARRERLQAELAEVDGRRALRDTPALALHLLAP